MDPNNYLAAIREQVKTYNYKAVEQICEDLTSGIYSTEVNFDSTDAEEIMQELRNIRMFEKMLKLGDSLIQTGRDTFKIRRQYGQALINLNYFTAAQAILAELVSATDRSPAEDHPAKSENAEARGLLGRLYKQLYIQSGNQGKAQNEYFLTQAIRFYLDVYRGNPSEFKWHGINAATLLKRGALDNLSFHGFPRPEEIAKDILSAITEKNKNRKAHYWEYATAGEACIVLNFPGEALEWMSGYARMPDCAAFELASTLRQLEEVWRLDMGSDMGKALLPLIRAELLKKQGANVMINPADLMQQKSQEAAISENYEMSVEPKSKNRPGVVLEKIFGNDSFTSYRWYMTGVDRCLCVARIGTDPAKGLGTGFLLLGKALHESLGEEMFLLTNAHVVSENPIETAMDPHQALIIFEALDRDKIFRIDKIFWTSPSNELDVSVIRFSREDQDELKILMKGIKMYPVTPHLPVIDNPPPQKIYVIGHPNGNTLQLSMQDNILLDYEDPKIHYRTPTSGGSSGSPVFNQQWDLIGLHHAGSTEMPCLHNKPGVYNANEGIWIESIKKKLSEHLK